MGQKLPNLEEADEGLRMFLCQWLHFLIVVVDRSVVVVGDTSTNSSVLENHHIITCNIFKEHQHERHFVITGTGTIVLVGGTSASSSLNEEAVLAMLGREEV